MSKILYIKSTPKSVEDSWSLKMSEKFLENYKKFNPDDIVEELDLYNEGIQALNAEELVRMPMPEETEVKKYANQFLEYDKFIIAAPFWNFSIPSILKAYIDRLLIAGKTFKYTEKGFQSLIAGKKMMLFMGRGGIYSEEPMKSMENGIKYLNLIFKDFFGLDTDSAVLEGTNVYDTDTLNKRFDEIKPELEKKAEVF
ncbi:FMN-dependent NADH-azoreductase [Sebaldella sp. S0638]|uniref:FMN-dependent NADH-azoreductase n=1 Tax=Sebaldella sp. S0638 TaxID=2957809 RepID=UPI0020A202AA|nr:NAD(P)H-dependent oxidoreductase [Sebaldella sp. S0638]MCP1224305.1 NAD(P)H-dependent oxidoreductase [Sebaldella sp. S0638]